MKNSFRILYHFSIAYNKSKSTGLVKYFATQNQNLGVLKELQKLVLPNGFISLLFPLLIQGNFINSSRMNWMNRTLMIIIALACVYIPIIQLPKQAIALPSLTKTKSSPPENALSDQQEIHSIAQKITVRVLPEKSPEDGASGILIEKQERTHGQQLIYLYLVLTNDHVLEILKKRAKDLGGGYQVQTFDGQVHKALIYKVNFRGNDLGLLWFSSTNSYELPQRGQSKSLKEYDQVFVAGFPSEKKLGEEAFTLTSGWVTTSSILSGKPLDAGYQLAFSNQTSDGMSGGAVLDKAGRLVGVNGRGKNQQQIFLSGDYNLGNSNPYAYFGGKDEPSVETQKLMRHFAWGIPIETYTQLAPQKPFNRLQPQLSTVDPQPTQTSITIPSLKLRSSPPTVIDYPNSIILVLRIILFLIFIFFLALLIIYLLTFTIIKSGFFGVQHNHLNTTPEHDNSTLQEPVITVDPTDELHPNIPKIAKLIINNSERTVKILLDKNILLLNGKQSEANIQISGNPQIEIRIKIPKWGTIIPIVKDSEIYKFDVKKAEDKKFNGSDEVYWDLYKIENGEESS
ncbi:serine protease [Nostoc sphaeroides CHAB 2801]|uniref:S1 family peptidase n=1 Tax=Nostoc sphaeroides TaxID=446679 RepID=UPI000E541892|nr:serine protease [Nostoc sphaeroides]MCC5634035.1 serine protease [Nostoc sphaeroides CHAB 2801]